MLRLLAILVAALALGGCSADVFSGQPAPTPAASGDAVAAAEASQLGQPAVTTQQADRIVSDIRNVTGRADAALDADVAATRLGGPALALRATNYTARTADATVPAVEAIPSGQVSVVLPQQSDEWPRTVFVVVDDESLAEDGSPRPQVAMMLLQDDARSNYRADYIVRLEPGAVIPGMAPADVGAIRISPDSKFLVVAPESISAQYSDVLMKDTASEFYGTFDVADDSLLAAAGLAYKTARIAAFVEAYGTSSDEFATGPAEGEVFALATNDSGAIVALDASETETAKVVEAGAEVTAIKEVAAITGKAKSAKGFTATYGYQLLFYVPSAIQGGAVTLLGYSQGVTSAAEVP
jgi:hypothetical protein